jgi:adenylylsulfate kinase
MSANQQGCLKVDQYPVIREDKEKRLQQRSKVIWLTGLSAAGKTSIAQNLEIELFSKGYLTQILDGDVIRSGISSNLTYTCEDRFENIRRIAEVSKLFINSGIISINSFISPTDEIRTMARQIIGEDNFLEVYVNAPLEICEKRDPKGLYAKARRGELKDFTGIDSVFEPPQYAQIEVHTDQQTVEESVRQILDYLLPMIEYKINKN